MRAKLQEIDYKYYETRIKVWDDNGNYAGEISLNMRENDLYPSDRERVGAEIEDSHYETQVTYEVAQKIVKALNEGG